MGGSLAVRYPDLVVRTDDSGYLEALAEGVVIFDGATGTNLQMRHLV